VQVSTTLGTRTLNLYDLSGQQLGASGLTLGVGKSGNLLVNVTDTLYQHVGYQVSATMSDLYPYAAANYNFAGAKLDSGNVSVAYPNNLVDLANLANLVNPVFTLTGALPLGLGSLAATTVQGSAQQIQTLAGHITNGLNNALPIQVRSGAAGPFSAPAQLSATGAPSVSGTPTQLDVMTGQQATGDLAGILAALKSALGNSVSAVPVTSLISGGYLDRNAVLAAIASATGQLGLVTANADAVLAAVSANLTSVGNLLGQTGSYNALPQLSVNVPSATPTGTYRGELTVTLADLPPAP
jgi:hypothetical protein